MPTSLSIKRKGKSIKYEDQSRNILVSPGCYKSIIKNNSCQRFNFPASCIDNMWSVDSCSDIIFLNPDLFFVLHTNCGLSYETCNYVVLIFPENSHL